MTQVQKRPYQAPRLITSEPFERLALACNGNNGADPNNTRGPNGYKEWAKDNPNCTVQMSS